MAHINITIHDKEDTNKIFPEIGDDPTQGALTHAAILEAGMTSGKTSISLIVEVKGEKILVQVSAAILNGVMSAVKGANERWGVNI